MRLIVTQRRRWRLIALIAAAAAVAVLAARVGVRRPRQRTPTREWPFGAARVRRARGAFHAGAASVAIALPAHPPLAGFGLFRGRARSEPSRPLQARALVLDDLAIVSLDLLEIPAALTAAVQQRAPAQVVWLCATHTHSGPGGYDPGVLPQLFGARSFDETTFDALVAAASDAVASAVSSSREARLEVARASHPELKSGRTRGALPDPALWALRALDAEDATIGTLMAYGAHPTLVPRAAATLSPDWPGAAADLLERAGGVGLVLQSVGGDSSPIDGHEGTSAARAAGFAARIARVGTEALARAPRFVPETVEVATQTLRLTPVMPSFGLIPAGTAVSVAVVGPLRLACLPGELTGAAWAEMRSKDPRLADVDVLSLCGDELSYIESRHLIERGGGERLVLFPSAAGELARALGDALDATTQP